MEINKLVLGLFIFQRILFAEVQDEFVPDSSLKEIVSDFLNALNSGDRKVMEDFIGDNYDENMLKRIPVSAVASLNMGFFYETAGAGYDLIKILVSGTNTIEFELLNKLTKINLKFQIPFVNAPGYKINGLIKSQPLQAAEKVFKEKDDDEIVKSLDLVLKKMEEDEEFSGAVMFAKDGRVLFQKAAGEASKSYKVPNKIDTKFNIASVGKIFTALAVMQLAERGKLSFNESISRYIPSDWLNPEVSSRIQIKHLLTHTSGLGDYFMDAYRQYEVPVFRELEDYKFLIADDTLSFEPGTKFSYSNTGFLLLGVIIEKVSGEKYFDFLKKNIFNPAGMKTTGGFYRDREVENRATGYSKIFEDGKQTWDNHQFTRVMGGSPSGGIYSTAEDMLKFDSALRKYQLLTDKYSQLLFEGQPELNVPFHSYAFFLSDGKGGRAASHQGDGRGVNCHYKTYIESGYTVIILSNYSVPSANIVSNVLEQLINF